MDIKLTKEEVSYLKDKNFCAESFKYYDESLDYLVEVYKNFSEKSKGFGIDEWTEEVNKFLAICKEKPEIKRLGKTVFMFRSNTYKKCDQIAAFIDMGISGIKILINARLKDLENLKRIEMEGFKNAR